MLKEVKIESVVVYTEKDGKQYINKNGTPYALVVIDNGDGQKASMYAEIERDGWKIKKAQELEGETATLDFEKKGEYLNWDFPRKGDLLEARVEKLEEQMVYVLELLDNEDLEEEETEPVDEDADPEDLPF